MPYDFSTIQDPLVQQYLKDKYGDGNKVKNAQQGVDNANAMSAVAGFGDMIANAGNRPQVLENRMQDLGSAPTIIQPDKIKTDVSGLQKQAQLKLDQATSDEDSAVKMAFEQRKAELAAEAAGKRQAVEDERWNRTFGGQEAARNEAVRHNKAMEARANQPKPLSAAEIKQAQEMRALEAAGDKKAGVFDSIRALRKGTSMTGPLAGRLGQGANVIGLSVSEDFDKLNAQQMSMVNQYIKDTTGASASTEEMKRLMQVMPSVANTDDLFENKIQALEAEAQAIINERRQAAGLGPAAPRVGSGASGGWDTPATQTNTVKPSWAK